LILAEQLSLKQNFARELISPDVHEITIIATEWVLASGQYQFTGIQIDYNVADYIPT
jgi:hypothetical protein